MSPIQTHACPAGSGWLALLPAAPALLGSFGPAVPSSLSRSAGPGWALTVVAIQQTGVSGGAGARSGSSVSRLSPPVRLLGLVPEHRLWHLQLGEAAACPETQRIRVPVVKLRTWKLSPVPFACCRSLLWLEVALSPTRSVSGSWVDQDGGFLSAKNKFIGGRNRLNVISWFSQTKSVGFRGGHNREGGSCWQWPCSLFCGQ